MCVCVCFYFLSLCLCLTQGHSYCSYVVNKHVSINEINICHFDPSQEWT